MLTKIITATLIAFTPLTLTACTIQQSTTSTTTEKLDPKQFSKIIDVRSIEEYDKEHLEGATLISINLPDFETKINELDKTVNYYVYSRSTARPDAAIKTMKENGFTGKLINGGNLFDASRQLDIEVVKPSEAK